MADLCAIIAARDNGVPVFADMHKREAADFDFGGFFEYRLVSGKLGAVMDEIAIRQSFQDANAFLERVILLDFLIRLVVQDDDTVFCCIVCQEVNSADISSL